MYDGVASGSTRRTLKAASQATRMRLEQILVIALLGDDDQVARIPDLLAEATSVIALTDHATDRALGLVALRQGRFEEAVERLSEPALTDGPASLGLARALQQLGRQEEARAQLKAVWKSQPGTLVGLLARRDYWKAAGESLQPSDMAIALNALYRRGARCGHRRRYRFNNVFFNLTL